MINPITHSNHDSIFEHALMVSRSLKLYFFPNHKISDKLHLGCGENTPKDWLNADIYNGDVYVDLNKRLPFPGDTFECVYSHHVIEHIEHNSFLELADELYRITRKGGVIRLVTPDLQKLIDKYEKNTDAFYLLQYITSDLSLTNCCMLNSQMRQLGEHRFIYDADELKRILWNAGFKKIKQTEYNKGSSPFRKIESMHKYGHIDTFSLCIEATK